MEKNICCLIFSHGARDLYKLRSAGHWLQLTNLSGQAELSSSHISAHRSVSGEALDLYLTTVESWGQTDQVFCEVMTAALYIGLFVTHNLICVLVINEFVRFIRCYVM